MEEGAAISLRIQSDVKLRFGCKSGAMGCLLWRVATVYSKTLMTREAREELRKKIDAGFKAGAAWALEEHYRMGRSIVVWRDGKVVTLKPEEYKDSIASALGIEG